MIRLFSLITFICLSTSSFSGENILWKDDINNGTTPKSSVVNNVLSQDKNMGYAGFLPIAKVNNKNYMLLSQEGNNGKATGTYCDCGGKVDKGETMVTAGIRELYEESSKVYDFRHKAEEVTKNSRFCYGNNILTGFVDVDYQKRQVFLDACAREKKKKHNHCFHEKSDFIWVDINHLYHSLNKIPYNAGHPSLDVQILNDDGNSCTKNIQLRDFFATTLKNSAGILKKYVTAKPEVVPPQQIQTINSLKEISTANFKPKTILLLDLDENLLLEKNHTQKKYHHLIDNKVGYRLIEKDIASTIEAHKSCINNDPANIIVLGLTKRGLKKNGELDRGHKHLEQNKVPLSRQRFKKFNGRKLCGNPNAGFYNGVIYTDGKDKGEYLEDFLKQTKFKPSHMAMADDKRQNLIDVQKLADKIGVSMEAYEMIGASLLQ